MSLRIRACTGRFQGKGGASRSGRRAQENGSPTGFRGGGHRDGSGGGDGRSPEVSSSMSAVVLSGRRDLYA